IEFTGLSNRMIQGIRLKNPNKIKCEAVILNVGCGGNPVKSAEWYNIDLNRNAGEDYVCDAGRKLPFPDGRFKGIFSEHFLEHLPEDDAKIFLAECFRVLIPGGILRLSVPNGELYLKKYFEDHEWLLSRWDGKYRTPMEALNRIFRQ